MSLIRRERRQWTPEPFVPPFPGATIGGHAGPPTSLTAMQSSAVWACVRLIASTVSMMPLQAYTLRGGVRVPLDTQPSLLRNPAADTTLLDWVYMVMVSLLLRGNAYGRIVRRDAMGYPVQIELLNPDDVIPKVDREKNRVVYTLKSTGLPLNAQDLFHVRAFRMPGLDVGLSPIQQHALLINRDAAIQRFGLGYFEDAPHPASVLTSDLPIKAEEARTIKERLLAAVVGREPLVLGAGLKFAPLSVSPNESQFLETMKYGASEVARIFGCPAQKIPGADVGNSMTYASVEMSGIDLLIYTIQWWLSNLESTLAPCFPGQQHVRFDPSVLLRTDFETTVKATAIGIASKQMTPDEARAKRDEPPLTDDQKQILSLVPLTVSPMGLPKALPIAAPEQEAEVTGGPA